MQSRTHTLTCKIYGDPDQCQEVEIQYSGSGQRKFVVDFLKVLTPLELEPSDLVTDLAMAISEDQHSVVASVECEIELMELIKQ